MSEPFVLGEVGRVPGLESRWLVACFRRAAPDSLGGSYSTWGDAVAQAIAWRALYPEAHIVVYVPKSELSSDDNSIAALARQIAENLHVVFVGGTVGNNLLSLDGAAERNDEAYCWAVQTPLGLRCHLPKGHTGRHDGLASHVVSWEGV